MDTVLTTLVGGAALKIVTDLIRVFARRIDGRWVHVLVVVLGAAAAVVQHLIGAGVDGGLTTALTWLTAILTAIGANETTRGKGKLGGTPE